MCDYTKKKNLNVYRAILNIQALVLMWDSAAYPIEVFKYYSEEQLYTYSTAVSKFVILIVLYYT